MSKSLDQLRQDIRDIDDRMLTLAAERLKTAKAIGDVKAQLNLPIKDFQVEKEVIEKSKVRARQLGLYEAMAEEMSRLLITYSVAAQDERTTKAKRAKTLGQQKILIAGGAGRMGLWLSEFFESFGHAVTHFDPAGRKTTYPVADDLEDAAMSHDVVVLSTPISVTAGVIQRLAAARSPALVFDICSLKSPLLPSIREAAKQGLKVTSAHPMFGPDVDLLAGRNILICDTGDAGLTQRTRALFEGTTANLVTLPIDRHDELMSYVLGLSHLTSLLFADVLAGSGVDFKELANAASTTFNAQLSVVRPVVKENQDLYYEIQAENAFTPELLKALEDRLKGFREALGRRDRAAFRQLMERGRVYLGGP